MITELIYKYTLLYLLDTITLLSSYFNNDQYKVSNFFNKIPTHLGIIISSPFNRKLDEVLDAAERFGIKKISFFSASKEDSHFLLNYFHNYEQIIDNSSCKICLPKYQIKWENIVICIWLPFEGHSLIESVFLTNGKTLTCTLGHGSHCEVDLCISSQEYLVLSGIPPQLLRLTEF